MFWHYSEFARFQTVKNKASNKRLLICRRPSWSGRLSGHATLYLLWESPQRYALFLKPPRKIDGKKRKLPKNVEVKRKPFVHLTEKPLTLSIGHTVTAVTVWPFEQAIILTSPPPVLFWNAFVERGLRTGGLSLRPPVDLPSKLPSYHLGMTTVLGIKQAAL